MEHIFSSAINHAELDRMVSRNDSVWRNLLDERIMLSRRRAERELGGEVSLLRTAQTYSPINGHVITVEFVRK